MRRDAIYLQNKSWINRFDMSQSRPKYAQDTDLYQKLLGSDIRLLRIHAADDTTGITCDLDQLPLDTRPDYYALSYVWGNKSQRRSILVNGQKFHVKENLYDALHHLRRYYVRRDFSPCVWIDAICINQNDINERSQQVTRMTSIYALSRQVIIWLGNCDESDQSIGEFFEIASAEALVRSSTDEPPVGSLPGLREDTQGTNRVSYEVDEDKDEEEGQEEEGGLWPDKIIALTTVLGMRPWFNRIWTVQEACLGAQDPILWAGHHCVAMQDLVDLLLDLAQVHPRYVVPCYNVLTLARIRQLLCHADPLQDGGRAELRDSSMGVAQFFLDLLCTLNRRRAKNPLDQLYGLLGLVGVAQNEELPHQLRPDYAAKTEQVYLRYATYLLNQTGDLRLLDFTKSDLEGVPSWVTDFRYLRGGDNHLTRGRGPVSTDGRILSVRGFTVGVCSNQIRPCNVANLICAESRKLVGPSCLARFRLFEKEILDRSANLGQRSFEATLQHWLSFLDVETSLPAYYDLIDRLEAEKTGSGLPWLAVNELSLVGSVAFGWLVLADGRVLKAGMVDAKTRELDLVCLFNGSRLPSVVRKTYHGFQFICPGEITDGPYGPGVDFDESFWAERAQETFELI